VGTVLNSVDTDTEISYVKEPISISSELVLTECTASSMVSVTSTLNVLSSYSTLDINEKLNNVKDSERLIR